MMFYKKTSLSLDILLKVVTLIFLLFMSFYSYSNEDIKSLVVDLKDLSSKIEVKIESVSSEPSISDENKKSLLDTYRKTMAYINLSGAHSAAISDYRDSRRKFEEGMAKAKADLSKEVKSNGSIKQLKEVSLPDLNQLFLSEKAEATALQVKLDEINSDITYQNSRPNKIRERLVLSQERRQELWHSYNKITNTRQGVDTGQSLKWLLASEYESLRLEDILLDQELLNQPRVLKLLSARKELVKLRRTNRSEFVDVIEVALNMRRSKATEQAQVHAESELQSRKDSHPRVVFLAKKNAKLSAHTVKTAEDIAGIIKFTERVSNDNVYLKEELERTTRRIDIAGTTQNLGSALIKQSQQLQDRKKYRKTIDRYNSDMANVMLLQIQYEEELEKLNKSELYIGSILSSVSEEEKKQVGSELQVLVKNRIKLLHYAVDTDKAYIRALGDLLVKVRGLQVTIKLFHKLLNEKMIWVKSQDVIDLGFVNTMSDNSSRELYLREWGKDLSVMWNNIRHSIPLLVVSFFACLAILYRQLGYSKIVELGRYTAKPSKDNIVYTLQALLISVAIAVPFPVVLAMAGWVVVQSSDDSNRIMAVQNTLFFTSVVYFVVTFFHTIYSEKGIAEIHFRRQPNFLHIARGRRLRYALTSLVWLFFVAIFLKSNTEGVEGGFSLILYIILLFVFSVFLYRAVHPIARYSSSKSMARLLSYVVGVSILFFIAFPLFGYIYGSILITVKLTFTLCFVFFMLLVHQLLIRWLRINHRRLLLKSLLEKREEQKNKQEGEQNSLSEAFGEVDEEPEIDLVSISEDSKQIVFLLALGLAIWGLVVIWADIVPAFSILDNIALWHRPGVEGGQEFSVPVSVGDIVRAICITFFLLVSARRLPGLLEIVILQRLDITSGARFTIRTLVRYSLYIIGVMWISGVLGLDWSKVQWLVAALGVGIGFGLQEIIANFICGLIILFERPIRIGDVVTIGGTDGIVTKIQTRATTIRTWDRRELLVPNKEFITGRLLNWSLSDKLTRIKIPIGIAYGSNVKLAMKLIEEAAAENENTVDDPGPYVSFEEFADSSLLLYLRCFIEYNENRISTISELHKSIDAKFREAGVTIAFPQMDVHLNLSSPLSVDSNTLKHDS